MTKYKYKCKKCGYVYDPDKGDLSQNVLPGTLFDNLPEKWVCPVCKANKGYFIKSGE